MRVTDLPIDERVKHILVEEGVETLRPAQKKAVKAGLLEGKNLLVVTPTASGKTLIAELGLVHHALQGRMGVYIAPLKALAAEKHALFQKRYAKLGLRIVMSIGDYDAPPRFIDRADILIVTSEKLDAMLRHDTRFAERIGIAIFDEIHLVHDPGRGPIVEMLATLLKGWGVQIIGLSATIGNPHELAAWLNAALVQDDWRPVMLERGIIIPTDEGVELRVYARDGSTPSEDENE